MSLVLRLEITKGLAIRNLDEYIIDNIITNVNNILNLDSYNITSYI